VGDSQKDQILGPDQRLRGCDPKPAAASSLPKIRRVLLTHNRRVQVVHRGNEVASVHDVANYIIGKLGPTSAMKLEKLVYYSQAWSLVWEGRPLFGARIEAWASGPVVRELYRNHRGEFSITSWPYGNGSRLAAKERETVDAVLKFYGDKSPFWLSELTHSEAPWIDARRGLAPGERGANEITLAAMAEYYSSL
jgi:uncharacterized phage-associated protein